MHKARAGIQSVEIGYALLDAVKLARERVGPMMLEIGHRTALAVWGNRGPTIVHWEESPHAVKVSLRLGDVMPLLSSATGRCFAAHVPTLAIAPMVDDELAQARVVSHGHVPRTAEAVETMLAEVRSRGIARAVNSVLPAMAGFCAPVFDFNRHMLLGVVALGSIAGFDTDWDGVVARALRGSAAQLSADLGYKA